MTKPIPIPAYVFSAIWSKEEDCYLGHVREFPSMVSRGFDINSTLQQLKNLVRSEVEMLSSAGKPVPEPLVSPPVKLIARDEPVED